MTEASIIRTFVNNHSIFHIIPCVRNNSYHSVAAGWVLAKIIFIKSLSSHKGSLREKKSINFVIHTVGMGMVRSSHSLFCHLALVHVTWRLVVVAERNSVGNNR